MNRKCDLCEGTGTSPFGYGQELWQTHECGKCNGTGEFVCSKGNFSENMKNVMETLTMIMNKPVLIEIAIHPDNIENFISSFERGTNRSPLINMNGIPVTSDRSVTSITLRYNDGTEKTI